MPEIQGVPYLNFLAGGMLCYSTMNSASFEALWSAYSRLAVQRTWEGILQAPMTVRDVVLGEWLWAGCKSLLSGSAILLVMYALGVVRGFAPLAVLPVVLLIGVCFAGIALVVTTLARSYDLFTFYFTLVITPMMFLSGVFFPRDSLPAVQFVGGLLPLSHGIDLVRGITLGRTVEQPLLHAGGAARLRPGRCRLLATRIASGGGLLASPTGGRRRGRTAAGLAAEALRHDGPAAFPVKTTGAARQVSGYCPRPSADNPPVSRTNAAPERSEHEPRPYPPLRADAAGPNGENFMSIQL